MKQFILLIITVLSICFVRCQPNKQNLSVSTILYPLEQTRTIDDIGPYVEDIIIIPVEEGRQTLISHISKMILDDDGNMYILDDGQRLIALKPDGTFLRQIARKGRGPKEYLHVEDIAISKNGEYLMLLQSPKIMFYGLKDTTLYKEINLPLQDPYDAIAPARDGGAYLFAAYPADREDYGKPLPMITRIDSTGNVIEQDIPRKEFSITIGNITQVSHNNYLLKPQNSDHIVYRLMPDSLSACYKIDFGNKNIPSNYEREKVVTDIGLYMRAPYFKSPMFFQETDSLLYFKAAGPQAQSDNFLYSREKTKGIHWTDGDYRFMVKFVASDADYLYVAVPSLELTEGIDDFCPLSRFLIDRIKAQDNMNQNPVIVKIRLNIS